MKRSTHKFIVVALLIAGCLIGGPSGITLAADGDPETNDTVELAAHLVETSGMSRGICTVLGWNNESFVFDVAQAGELLVHGWTPRASSVKAAQEVLDEAGLYGHTAVVEHGPLGQLPYANDMIDLIVAAHLSPGELSELSAAEVLRVLRPEGKLIIGRPNLSSGTADALTADDLKNWLQKAGLSEAPLSNDDYGQWAVVTKPPMEGVDDWSHWEHSPDNNPVSEDSVIKAPYLTKWLGAPYYTSMPAITTAAGGRIFNAIGHIAHHKREEAWLNTLLARNGYNGTILWSRELPSGYLVHRSAFVATDDVFYMIDTDGSGCLLLDPETGDELGRINIAGVRGDWKWMAIKDGILFALVGAKKSPTETTIVRSKLAHWSWGELSKGYYGKRVPWGFGRTLVAYDLTAKKRLWIHREKKTIDSRAMVLGGDKIFLYSPDAHITCLDMRTGKTAWENADPKVRSLIEQQGRGLASTPGFRSMTFCVHTPDALIFQAQTRMNVVAISTADGYLLWNKKKTTNNPNALYIDDKVAVGIGKGGNTLLVDPVSGEEMDDLGFMKRSCARLTATSDSLFCRGWPEGLTRFDRKSKKVLFNGAVRPGCNDGVVAANGLLYVGPWPCDCNLMLLGRVALTSADSANFDFSADPTNRLQLGKDGLSAVTDLEASAKDWPTYRGNIKRGAGTSVSTPGEVSTVWEYQPDVESRPTAATTSGGLVFMATDEGKVLALDAVSGDRKWTYLTAGPILSAPAIWKGRAYVGSGDGFVYAIEAASGRLLWKFRAAPVERRIPVYGKLSSSWPVHSGVLVDDGVVYAAAGIIDYDGTYVYALDAITGEVKWKNESSGHLDADLRKGVSAHGDLTLADGRLWMPGGNVVSPAAYDLETGEYRGSPPGDGSPKSNRGEEIGIFGDDYVVLGGRLRFSPIKNVVNPGSFVAHAIKSEDSIGAPVSLHQGKIPPTWDDEHVAMVDGRLSVPACYTAEAVEQSINSGGKPKPKWIAEALQGGDAIALTVTPNAVLAICEMPQARDRNSRWILCALDIDDGSMLWERTLPEVALPGGLSVDRDGRIIVVLADGRVVCYGDEAAIRANVAVVTERAQRDPAAKQLAVGTLSRALKTTHSAKVYKLVLESLESLGVEIDAETRKNGGVSRWHLIGPVPWDGDNDVDKRLLGEPNIDLAGQPTVAGRALTWRQHMTDDPNGKVDLVALYGPLAEVAVYAYAEVDLPEEGPLLLKIGSNDGFKCWFNGKEVGRFDEGRGYSADQDTIEVHATAGVNRILLKITQMGFRWAFGVRLTDRDGRPVMVNYVPN